MKNTEKFGYLVGAVLVVLVAGFLSATLVTYSRVVIHLPIYPVKHPQGLVGSYCP